MVGSDTTRLHSPNDLTLACGQEPTIATSENSVMAKFAEIVFYALG
jgi:hypothetical protein